jgi:hypothetical protein
MVIWRCRSPTNVIWRCRSQRTGAPAALSDAARRHHDELFPGRVSTLAKTDPELIEYFDNFAFDEVLRDTGLDLLNASDIAFDGRVSAGRS